ncbi:MAG: hypothetical protein ACFNO3_00625 [Alloprevotella tannerae]
MKQKANKICGLAIKPLKVYFPTLLISKPMLLFAISILVNAATDLHSTKSRGRINMPTGAARKTNGGGERIKEKPRQKLWLQEKTVRAIATNKPQHVSTATSVTGNDSSTAKRASMRTMT